MKLIEARGTPEQIGEQLGEQLKETALELAETFRQTWARKGLSTAEARNEALFYHSQANEFNSDYSREIFSYCKAVGLDYMETFAWFCPQISQRGCTDIVLNQHRTDDGRVYLMHNEDYDVTHEKFAVPVKISPDGKPSFIAMTYGGIWFNAGVNECGIGVGGNALTPNDERFGIPADFAFRKIFDARTIGEAMDYSTPHNRANSHCNIIVDLEGEMYAMEASATDFAALHSFDWLAHTNHYLSPVLQKFDSVFERPSSFAPGSYAQSIIRHNRACNLVKTYGKNNNTYNRIAMLMDHHNHPWSICRHPDPKQPVEAQTKTCFSQIINVTDREMLVCIGNPCENDYELYKL